MSAPSYAGYWTGTFEGTNQGGLTVDIREANRLRRAIENEHEVLSGGGADVQADDRFGRTQAGDDRARRGVRRVGIEAKQVPTRHADQWRTLIIQRVHREADNRREHRRADLRSRARYEIDGEQ